MHSSLLGAIKSKVSEKAWKTWFISFDVLKIEGNKVIFCVANPFIREWLERRYGKTIARVVKEKLGEEATFEIVVTEEESSEEDQPLARKKPVILSPLNPEFTFENFVVGRSNQLAYSASYEISTSPGRFNPFFLFGGVGLGKTHLAQAIARETLKTHPDLRVMYITSEDFMNDMIEGIKNKELFKVREKYRKKVDVLIIDDIQFLMDKPGIQQELFHTFNYLHDAGKQLVFCSDRDPKFLEGFHERLISRFKMGLVVGIESPDSQTRYEVAKRFAEREGLELPEDYLRYLASMPVDNFRHIRGIILKLVARWKFLGVPPTLDLIEKELAVPKRSDPAEEMLKTICTLFGVSKEELLGRSRKAADARAVTCYALVKNAGLKVTDVARLLGRSKSTISYLINRGEKLLTENPKLAGELGKLEPRVNYAG